MKVPRSAIVGGLAFALTLFGEGASGAYLGHFSLCAEGESFQCVQDGRTIWLRGQLVQLDGIGAVPSKAQPQCGQEAGQARATPAILVKALNSAGHQASIRFVGTSDEGIPLVRIIGEEVGDMTDFLVRIGAVVTHANHTFAFCY